MEPLNILYLLLATVTTTGTLRVTMRMTLLSVLRDENTTIPCDILDLNTGRPISILWKKTFQNGTEQDVYEYNNGQVKSFREESYMTPAEILKGNAELHIPRVQFSDDAKYTCTVINTPDKAEGRTTLEVSAPPSAFVIPEAPSIEEKTEKTVQCEVSNFFPKDVSIRWAHYRKGFSDCEILEMWTCVKTVLDNPDGTYNVTSLLTLNPKKEDNGDTYSCLISHRSLRTELSRNLTITVTEKEDNTGAVITAVILTILLASLLGLFGFLYIRFVKKDPPTLSDITGNDKLIDMNRTTLTCQIMDFRPNNIEISVCIKRCGEQKMTTIYVWKYPGHPAPTISKEDGGGNGEVLDLEQGTPLINGFAGDKDRPLQLEMAPCVKNKTFGKFTCQCSLHITPSYDLDNRAELIVLVKHPALTSPASVRRTLKIIGVSPKLLSIMSPGRFIHNQPLTLTCPINGFKPRALSVTWLKKKDNQETDLITWEPAGQTIHSKRCSHRLTEDEHEDKSYSFISALTMTPNLSDGGVTYICRTFHPATNHQVEKELTMRVIADPVLDPIQKPQEAVCVGEKLELSCRIHSFYPPPIQVTWYTGDNVEIPSQSTLLKESGGLYHVTSTSCHTITMKDVGKEFRCEVQHEGQSKCIRTVVDIVSPPTLGEIESVPAQPELGKPVKLSCKISNMYPGDPSIQWYLGLTKYKPEDWKTNFQQNPDSKIFSGTTELPLKEELTNYQYAFQLEVVHNGKTFKKDYRLRLEGLLMLSEISCDPKDPDYGKPLTLSCNVSGCNPGCNPKVTWSEEGEQKETRHNGDVLSCSLTIGPTAEDYGKIYTCTVTQEDMKKPVEKTLHLRLPERSPTLSEIVVYPKTVTADQELSFQVTISGFSPRDLQIKWYKGFSVFRSSEVTMSELEIGSDHLFTCNSILKFTPRSSDDKQSIRCEVTHSQTKTVIERRYVLDLTEGSAKARTQHFSDPEKKTFHIREIKCLTERPLVGEEVTLVAYIEGCQADDADFSWYRGMYSIDEEIENRQDGTGCTSTVTFLLPETSDKDCTIKLDVFYNYQSAEEIYKLRLV